jgi:hypothetical protein
VLFIAAREHLHHTCRIAANLHVLMMSNLPNPNPNLTLSPTLTRTNIGTHNLNQEQCCILNDGNVRN